ncbi:CFI-box-CTERM domain-containing protein [Methanosphaera sp.]
MREDKVTINYVDLYETRAVRHNTGISYGKRQCGYYHGQSRSTQEWTNLGRGTLTLTPEKIFFNGGGESRTIDRKKINEVNYYTKMAGIEISVSNRQKTMRYILPGRTVDDGKNLCEAIEEGRSQVLLTPLTQEPSGCYIATYFYGNYNAPEVLKLRDYRDNHLQKHVFGRLFIKTYYKTSPTLIKYFNSNIFKNTSKKILDYILEKIH